LLARWLIGFYLVLVPAGDSGLKCVNSNRYRQRMVGQRCFNRGNNQPGLGAYQPIGPLVQRANLPEVYSETCSYQHLSLRVTGRLCVG
jgi:hypothetical protein